MHTDRTIKLCGQVIDWSLRATVFLVPIFFAWFQENFNVFDLNKSAALRAGIAVALIAWVVRFCLRPRTGWSGGRRTFALLLALAAVFTLSTLCGLHPNISFLGTYERQQGLLNIFHYLALFMLIAASVADRAKAKALIAALLAGSALAAAYGLLQAFSLDFFRWGESSDLRIFSTFGQPNFLGHYFATLLPLTIYAFVYMARRFWQHLGWGLVAALQAFALVCTYSRGAWIALALSLLALAFWELWRRGRKTIFIALLVLMLAGASALFLGNLRDSIINTFVTNGSGLSLRIASLADPLSGSGKSRLLYWQGAWTAMRQATPLRQLFGFGPDNQADAFAPQYRPEWAFYEQMNSYPDRAHNFFFDILLQFGWIGLALFALFAWLIFIRLLRYARRCQGQDYWLAMAVATALSAYAVNNLFSFSLTGMNVVLYALLGLAAVIGSGFRTEERTWDFFQPLSRWLIAGAVSLLLGIAFYGYAIRPYVADYYFFEAKKAEARTDCRGLIDTMETILEWHPDSHYYQQMYLHWGTNCFSAAGNDASRRQLATNLIDEARAIPEAERQYRTLMYMAQMYSIVGFDVNKSYYADAETMYRDLIARSPYITVNYQDYGRLLLWQRKDAEAIAAFKAGLDHMPRLADAPNQWHTQPIIEQQAYFYELLGTAYADLGQDKEAESWLKRSISVLPSMTAAYKKLADIAYKHHDLAAAIRYNKIGFSLEKSKSLWPFGLAALYKEQGDRAEAMRYAKLALELDPQNQQIKALIGELSGK